MQLKATQHCMHLADMHCWLQQAFKAGNVDLPTEGLIAPMHAITLPDNFNNLDFGLNGPSFTLE